MTEATQAANTTLDAYRTTRKIGCPFCGASVTLLQLPTVNLDLYLVTLMAVIRERCLRCGATYDNVFKFDHCELVELGKPMENRKPTKATLPASMPQPHEETKKE